MSEGARCRFMRIPGETPKGILDQPMVLPAVLNALELTEESHHTEYETVQAGQFSQGNQGGSVARMLRAIQLEGLVLGWDAPWLVEAGVSEDEVRAMLAAVLRSHKPVEMLLLIDEASPAFVRMDVTFRSLSLTSKPGEPDTTYFTVQVKEWRDPRVERKGNREGRKPGVRFPTTVELNDTDTLESLAHEYYGTYSSWRAIREANGISTKFGQSTPLVTLPAYKVGSRIKLPKIEVTVPVAKGRPS
jgi:nucleoid-associated protein YgaU